MNQIDFVTLKYKVLYMKEKDAFAEISSIKNMMERSTKFISLSGLSGVMAGIYAIIGAGIAYKLIYQHTGLYRNYTEETTVKLFLVACIVLFLSILTGLWLSIRKAKRKGLRIWSQSSRAFLINGALPLVAGGMFILILLSQNHFDIVAAASLIFYGLALTAASQFTYGDVKWLGICEIALGLFSATIPGLGLLFWTIGFGVLHILYGTIMHFKYDRENSAE